MMADIRPEFLKDVIQDGGFHLRSPVQGCLTQAALLRRIIGVGQAGFQSISCYLGPVEARTSRICFSDEGARYRVARAAKKPSVTHSVVARVLVRNRRDNGLGEKSPRYSVLEGPPIIASITLDSAAQLRIGI